MKISVVGTGYVGLVGGLCMAEIGHEVICVDIDEAKIEKLKSGVPIIYEPGLDKLLKDNIKRKRISFSTDLTKSVQDTSATFIAVGTPQGESGKADLKYVYKVAEQIGKAIKKYHVIIDKSTVPVGTAQKVASIIKKHYKGDFDVVSNPEFLREGSAIMDFMVPDRIVIGTNSKKARKVLDEIYEPVNAPKLFVDTESAELIKYASNSFLAMKISFINEIANLCEKVGANVKDVAEGVGLDSRVGPKFLSAGFGYGGSCFPKDVSALLATAKEKKYNFKLIESVLKVNSMQRKLFVENIKVKAGKLKSKRVAVLGLAFKGNTDDVRESPAIDVINLLLKEGAKISAFDPEAMENAKFYLKNKVSYCKDIFGCLRGSDIIVVATEWKEFGEIDWKKVKKLSKAKWIFDGKNILDIAKAEKSGFCVYAVGRGDDKSKSEFHL